VPVALAELPAVAEPLPDVPDPLPVLPDPLPVVPAVPLPPAVLPVMPLLPASRWSRRQPCTVTVWSELDCVCEPPERGVVAEPCPLIVAPPATVSAMIVAVIKVFLIVPTPGDMQLLLNHSINRLPAAAFGLAYGTPLQGSCLCWFQVLRLHS